MCRDSNKRRESIDKDTNKESTRKGVDLEFNMVSSQLAAMNYAAPLARGLAVVETNPRRKEFRQQTDRKLADLQGQVHQVFFSRYQRQN
jgi:5-enolpyruvylshikimate-3-phosphate synthase